MFSNAMRYQKAAQALRANLKRRKTQARARADIVKDADHENPNGMGEHAAGTVSLGPRHDSITQTDSETNASNLVEGPSLHTR